MTGTVRAFRSLAGDAIAAIGHLVAGTNPNTVDISPDYDATVKIHDDYGWHAPFRTDEGAMELDGPMLSWPAPPPVTQSEVREALDELSDATLFGICATIIEGWKPILFTSEAGKEAAVDVDVLVDTLRDRRDQFRAVEADADQPFPNPTDLVYPTYTPQFRDE